MLATSHYPQAVDNPSGRPRGSVLTVEFEVLGRHFTALNGGPLFAINPSISFFVRTETAARCPSPKSDPRLILGLSKVSKTPHTGA